MTEELKQQRGNMLRGVLDPLIKTLITYEDDVDLEARIDNIYQHLDIEGIGLSHIKLRLGLKSHFGIHLTQVVGSAYQCLGLRQLPENRLMVSGTCLRMWRGVLLNYPGLADDAV